MPDKYVMVTK